MDTRVGFQSIVAGLVVLCPPLLPEESEPGLFLCLAGDISIDAAGVVVLIIRIIGSNFGFGI